MTDYEFLIFDAQYFLTRNFKALESRTMDSVPLIDSSGEFIRDDLGNPIHHEVATFEYPELITSFFQSIVKFTRDCYSCDKVILLFDKWPYHKSNIIDNYKGSRYYPSEDDLVGLDETTDYIRIADIKEEIKSNKKKQYAKYWIINNISNLGMYPIIIPGYEADDLAKILSDSLANSDRKSAIVSIDSDWMYWINQNVDCLKPNGNLIRYIDVLNNVMNEVGNSVDIYEYKLIYDSLYGSHNDLIKCLKSDVSDSNFDIFRKLKSGDYSILEDIQVYKNQLESFNYKNYPDYQDILGIVDDIKVKGSIFDEERFRELASTIGLRISSRYYSNYINNLNKDLYKDEYSNTP